MNIVDHYRAEFSSRDGYFLGTTAAQLHRRRHDALDRFANLGFPSSRQEAWKYTPIDTITQRPYKPWDVWSQDSETPGKVWPQPNRDDLFDLYPPHPDSHCLVFVNGRHDQLLSQSGNLPIGITVGNLVHYLDAPPKALEEHLDRHVATASSNGFAALNSAFLSEGAFIHLAPDTIIDAPIHLLFISTLDDDEAIIHPRVLIVAEENSTVEVVEHFTSLGGGHYFTNAVTEISLGTNANLKHCKIQTEARQALHVATLQAYQAKDSHFASHSVSLGGRLTRNDINAVIGAEGSECTLDGLYMADGRQHVDYHTRIEHAKPHGTSHQRYKGVLMGKARGVFNGQIYVHPDAQHTDATQRNENLLLSRDAEVNTEPQLNIFADDVQCAHGATVGQLDKNMIFYLRARGIPADTAFNMLTYGFINEILDLAPIAAIKPKLGEIVLAKLPDADKLKDQVLELVPHAA
uniref:Iron-regulated ABC transporter permease protein SufD n=1 Tax=Candidatus Kentrum sp. FW TaxID=2126338 RepID=A0A450T3Q6_9GAMM|nr:MAG: Iron-regulated ABC transporter permease protein SufD [Candidatus Kentron sp. FW]